MTERPYKLRACTPFNSKAAQILQNKSEETQNQSRLNSVTVCDSYGNARLAPLTVVVLTK